MYLFLCRIFCDDRHTVMELRLIKEVAISSRGYLFSEAENIRLFLTTQGKWPIVSVQ